MAQKRALYVKKLGMGQAENGNPADVPVQLVDGVNVTNGNLFLSDLHFQFNGAGPAFGVQVAYNARADPALTPNTPLGRKWTHSLNWFVDLDPGVVRELLAELTGVDDRDAALRLRRQQPDDVQRPHG